jgi:capsid protein
MATKIPAFDRALLKIAPGWARNRIRARLHAEILARHYEAADLGRRNTNWKRSGSDANTAAGAALPTLRNLSRDLRRNNPWARRGVQVVANNSRLGHRPGPPARRTRGSTRHGRGAENPVRR